MRELKNHRVARPDEIRCKDCRCGVQMVRHYIMGMPGCYSYGWTCIYYLPERIATEHHMTCDLAERKDGRMTPTLTLIRGLPGSGKSYYGRHLAAERGCLFLEPDMLLTIGGKYVYTKDRHENAVESCRVMISDIGACIADVIYADVLPTIQEVQDIAMFYGTLLGNSLEVIDMPLITVEQSIERNKHNVRREDIERMAADWEPWERKQKEAGDG